MSDSGRPADAASAVNGLFQGALSLLNAAQGGSSGGGGPTSSSSSNSGSNRSGNGSTPVKQANTESTPDDIPREDLVHLCMKMNKKMQAMETKGQELTRKKNLLLADKHTFLEFINLIPLRVSFGDDDAVDKEVLATNWSQYNELQQKLTRSLEEKNKALIRDLSLAESKYREELLNAKARASNPEAATDGSGGNSANQNAASTAIDIEIKKIIEEREELQVALREADSKVRLLELELEKSRHAEYSITAKLSAAESSLAAKTESMSILQKEFDASKAQSEEKILYLQVQLNSFKSMIDSRDKELVAIKKTHQTQTSSLKNAIEEKELTVKNDKDVIIMLQKKLMYMEPELERCRENLKENEKHLSSAMVMKAEQEVLIESMRRDLRISLERRDEEIKKSRECEDYKSKSETLAIKVQSLVDQLNASKSELEEQMSLVTRMKSEAQISERNYAMKTAMLATCEAQLESLKSISSVKDDTIKETLERVSVLQSRIASSDARLEEKTKEITGNYAALEKEYADFKSSNESQISAMKLKHEEALEAQKRDFAKKSSLARTLLSEREEEVRVLSNRVKELQSEINSGAPSERKIFELAQLQAKRDALHGMHGDSREFAFLQLQKSLADRDFELADAVQKYSALNAEVESLRRVSRRENVNMDYLKNIILQFMTFPVTSPERISLIPVIATLLQFNPKEIVEVDKVAKDPNSNTRPVKEIRRSLQNASMSSVAVTPAHTGGPGAAAISIVPTYGNAVYTSSSTSSSSTTPSNNTSPTNSAWLDTTAHSFKLASPKSKIAHPQLTLSTADVTTSSVVYSTADNGSSSASNQQNKSKKYTSISL
jgi:hypothetical protein